MKIIPGNVPVVLDGKTIRSVLSVELGASMTADGRDMYAIITVKLDHAETSVDKIELSSFTS